MEFFGVSPGASCKYSMIGGSRGRSLGLGPGRGCPEDGLVRESRVVTGPFGHLSVDVPAEGGFAAIACRWSPRVDTCDEPVDAIPFM